MNARTHFSYHHTYKCDQCEMVSINGVACHELGCPNVHSRWDSDSGSWIKQRACFECGCIGDVDEPCCDSSDDTLGEYSGGERC